MGHVRPPPLPPTATSSDPNVGAGGCCHRTILGYCQLLSWTAQIISSEIVLLPLLQIIHRKLGAPAANQIKYQINIVASTSSFTLINPTLTDRNRKLFDLQSTLK